MATILFNSTAKVQVNGTGATVVVGRKPLPAVTTLPADAITIADAGAYFDATEVEGALQEIGAQLKSEGDTYLAPVISFPSSPPLSPSTGDRYLVSGVAQGAWAGQENKVAEWDGMSWAFTAPVTNAIVLVLDTLTNYRYNGSIWVIASATALLQGGNNFFGDVYAGTQGAYLLRFITSATTRAYIDAVGNFIALHSVASPVYKSAVQTLTASGGLIAWNVAGGQLAKVTLSADATLSNPTNDTAAFPSLEVWQDGTGGHTLSFGTAFVLPSDWEAVAEDANSMALYSFYKRSDGKILVAAIHYGA